jgi:hypothetical protein
MASVEDTHVRDAIPVPVPSNWLVAHGASERQLDVAVWIEAVVEEPVRRGIVRRPEAARRPDKRQSGESD